MRTKLTTPTSPIPLSPIRLPAPVIQSPTSSTAQPIAIQTISSPTEFSVLKITHTDNEMNIGSRLSCYSFPSLQFNKYVISYELFQHLMWTEAMFECLFHSIQKKVPMKKEKTHLLKVLSEYNEDLSR